MNEYRDAVHDYEVAFEIAEQDARRRRDSGFEPAERKRLATAQQLLSVAVDEAATAAERQVAYRRVRQELDGLIALPDQAIEVLESKVSAELTSGRSGETDTPAGPSSDARAAAPSPAAPTAPAAPATWPIPTRDPRTQNGAAGTPGASPTP